MESIDEHGSFLDDSTPLISLFRNIPSFNYRYINEFSIYKIKQITSTDLRLWQLFLQSRKMNINDDLEIIIWKWVHDYHTYYFKDFRMKTKNLNIGAIYFYGDIIFIDNNGELTSTKVCPQIIQERMTSFQHIRLRPCLEDNFSHHHCVDQEMYYQSIK